MTVNRQLTRNRVCGDALPALCQTDALGSLAIQKWRENGNLRSDPLDKTRFLAWLCGQLARAGHEQYITPAGNPRVAQLLRALARPAVRRETAVRVLEAIGCTEQEYIDRCSELNA